MFDRVLVPLDGSPLAECVLPHAAAFASAFNAQITLVHVLEQPSASLNLPKADPLDWYLKKSEATLYLDNLKRRLEETGASVQTLLLEGRASEQIIELAHSTRTDLLILSDCGSAESSRQTSSSNVLKILQGVRSSILLVRMEQPIAVQIQPISYQRLLVPLDGSQRAGSVLTLVTALAQAHRADLLLMHVVAKPEMARHMPLSQEDLELSNRFVARNQEEGRKYLDQIDARLPVKTLTHLIVSDNVAASIQTISDQERIDLLVLSAHGYSGEARWPYGSVTNRFITNGSTSLLIVQDLPQSSSDVVTTNVETRQSVR
jgi:nucleotide-binding universal stress UspA family protein